MFLLESILEQKNYAIIIITVLKMVTHSHDSNIISKKLK